MKKKKNQGRKTIISVLLVFLIMVIAVAVIFATRGKEKTIAKDSNQRLQVKTEEDNISAYDETESYRYIVEYYYDGDIDSSLTEIHRAKEGTVINTYSEKAITGYKRATISNYPLTVSKDEGANIIRIYYVKANFEYAIEYWYDGVRDDDLTETQETAFGTKIKSFTDNRKPGYKKGNPTNFPLTVGANVDYNVIRVYYEKDYFDYTVEYYYDGDIEATETKRALFGSKINTYDDKTKTGYSLTDRTKLPLTISEEEEKNVIRLYYTKNKYNYTVEYYYDGEKDTTKTEEIEAAYGDEIEEFTDNNIKGYKLLTTSKLPLKITEVENKNKIKVYYVVDDENKKSLSYTVKYYKDGKEQVSDTELKMKNVQILEPDILEVNKEEIDTANKYLGYTFEKTVPATIPDTVETGAVIKVYYITTPVEVKSIKVTQSGTPEITSRNDRIDYKIKYEAKINNYIGEAGAYVETKLPYEIDQVSSVLDGGTYSRADNTIVWDVDLGHINTYESGRNVAKTVKIEKNITVLYKNIDLLKDYMVSSVSVGLYLPAQDVLLEDSKTDCETAIGVKGTVDVKYIDKNSNEEIIDTKVKKGKIGDQFDVTDDVEKIPGYILVEEPASKTGLYKEEKQERIYYYSKNTKVSVKYVDKATGKEIEAGENIAGFEGQSYETKQKTIANYTFVEATPNTKGIMTNKTIEVIYYYLYNTKVTVQYIDASTDRVIDSVEITGLEGDTCETVAKEISGYILSERPVEATVKMKKEEIIVKYYYLHISSGVIEKHIDQITGQILSEKVHEGKEGDKYRTEEKAFKGYDFMPDSYPSNSVGKMTVDTIEVKYYYKKKATVIAEYIDKATKDKIVKSIKTEGHEDDNYTTETKIFEGYKLERIPDNANGRMKVTVNADGTFDGTTTVTYYYVHQSAGVDEKHVDEMSGNILAQTHYEGFEGDEYTTEEKEFMGYNLNKDKYPANAKGKMSVELTEVTYYYKKQASAKVQYVDKNSGEVLEKIEINGSEGDEYDTVGKEFDEYEFVEAVGEVTGKLDPSEQKLITYYYIKQSKVVVKYLNKETNEALSEETVQLGHEGDAYTTTPKEISDYIVAATPKNAKGVMTKEPITVVYYYRKPIFDFSIKTNINSIIKGSTTKNMKNAEIAKVEIDRKKLDKTSVSVVFNVIVKNTGEVPGKVTILEKVPEGFRMYEKDNKGWKVTDNEGRITTEEMAPGKSKTYKVTLKWLGGEDNMGTIKNEVAIEGAESAAGYVKLSTKNDKSDAQVVVSVATGAKKISIIVLIVLAYFAVITFINKKLNKNKKSNIKGKRK